MRIKLYIFFTLVQSAIYLYLNVCLKEATIGHSVDVILFRALFCFVDNLIPLITCLPFHSLTFKESDVFL